MVMNLMILMRYGNDSGVRDTLAMLLGEADLLSCYYKDLGVLLFQLSLLGTLCSLLVKYGNDSEVRDTLGMLLQEAAKKYLKAQKSAPNQKQVGVINNDKCLLDKSIVMILKSELLKPCCCRKLQRNTVKTLYNVTRYNRIFNIRQKISGNRSVSIKIPSL